MPASYPLKAESDRIRGVRITKGALERRIPDHIKTFANKLVSLVLASYKGDGPASIVNFERVMHSSRLRPGRNPEGPRDA